LPSAFNGTALRDKTFDQRHGQRDVAASLDADEGVGREASFAGGLSVAVCERQSQAQYPASACSRSGLQETAPGDSVR